MSSQIIPQPAPTLESRWEDARAGRITWPAFQKYQASLLPRCEHHRKRPMATYEGGLALCAECYTAVVEARREEILL